MKKLLTLALVFVPLLAAAQDDLYFTPSKKAKAIERPVRPAAAASERQTVRPVEVDYGNCSRSDNDYNRRYMYNGDRQNAGGLQVENDSTLAATDSLEDVWAGYDIDDPELDYRYSRRLVRFHSPRYYSPYYWDLMYTYGAWDYLYEPYDPWYWHFGWRYGWSWGPWDCWYGGIWGWGHPYHWAYWGWGPDWHIHYGGIGIVYNPREYRPRGTHLSNRGTGSMRNHGSSSSYVGRGNSAIVRASGARGSAITAHTGGGGASSSRGLSNRGTLASRSNGTAARGGSRRSSSAGIGQTDYTGGRTSANRYGQRGAVSSSASRYSSVNHPNVRSSSSSVSRGSNSYSRSSSTYSAPSMPSRSYSSGPVGGGGGVSSYSGGGGGGSYSGGGGGGGRGGGGGGGRR